MQPVSEAQGRFVWYELMTTDIPAAVSFYTKVIGWEMNAWPTPDGQPPYQMWKVPGKAEVGGVFSLPEEACKMGAPPAWLGNICVADLDGTLAKLQALGGQVHRPAFEVPDVGRVAIVADPTGATFALYQPSGQAPGHGETSSPGEFSWSELYSLDLDKAWAFYQALLGWQDRGSMDMGPMGKYQMFSASGGENANGGMMKSPPEMPVSAWGFYTTVANLHGAIERAVGLGATLVNGPMDVPGGDEVATLQDPQGAFFSLHSRKE